MNTPETVPGRLLSSLGEDGTAPRLTWYGSGGERVELSGRVLANWVTKATNLLVEEADAGPGSVVILQLPVHWRAVIWTLAAWTTGARVVLAEDCRTDASPVENADVIITAAPDRLPEPEAGRAGADLVLAVALPALAMAWEDELPEGVMDAAAEVLGYGDALGHVSVPDPADAALGDLTYGELAGWASDAAGTRGRRALLVPSSVRELLRESLGAWLAGGSVVLVEPDLARTDPPLVERVATDERVDRP